MSDGIKGALYCTYYYLYVPPPPADFCFLHTTLPAEGRMYLFGAQFCHHLSTHESSDLKCRCLCIEQSARFLVY